MMAGFRGKAIILLSQNETHFRWDSVIMVKSYLEVHQKTLNTASLTESTKR
jgi:hypothetical protein